MKQTLRRKKIHGVFFKETEREMCDQSATKEWLRQGRLEAATESLVVAAQDGVVHSGAYRARVIIDGSSPTCRICGEGTETLGHILSSCKTHKFKGIKDRHDRVLYCLVTETARALKVATPKREPRGGARSGLEGTRQNRLMVDLTLATDKGMTERRPDLVVALKRQKRLVVLEVAVAWEPGVSERFQEKADKYRGLGADLANTYKNYAVTTIPVVMGSMGLVAKRLKVELRKAKFLTHKSIDRLISNMQREALCGSVRLIRTHLAVEAPEAMDIN